MRWTSAPSLVVPCNVRRRTVLAASTAIALAVVLFVPAKALADLALLFVTPRAHWGQRVQAASPGAYAPFADVRVYLVPMALARSGRTQRSTGLPSSPRIKPVGWLRLRSAGSARLSFIVPRVQPGDYTLGFLCLPCAPPAGAFFTTAKPGTRWTPRQHKILRISRQ
jgi:hypothetical protein